MYKDSFKLLEGNLNVEASNLGSTTISYPAGYNKDNTAIISFGMKLNKGSRGYAYGYTSETVFALALTINEKYIELTDEGITLTYKNDATSPKSYDYKIVIMKID